MAQSKQGAIKVAADRLGISIDEYITNTTYGLKHCMKCRTWKLRAEFSKDSSRHDGLNTSCIPCRSKRTAPGPTKYERRKHHQLGLAWCRRCNDWQPVAVMRGGLCHDHTNSYNREQYHQVWKYTKPERYKGRRKGVENIPYEAQLMLLEEFENKCAYCDAPATAWDHIIPITKGGKTVPWNIVPACKSCNSSKNANDVDDWIRATGRTPCEAFENRRLLAEI